MDGKKSFFELLDAKSALIVGLVGGLLGLGTLGFLVLGTLMVRGFVPVSSGTVAVVSPGVGTAPAPAVAPTAPPANIVKSDRPKVELFVMSYCPYGLQMEKAYVPAWQLLKDKADMDVKFVSYAMHGLKEVEENTRQYCIQSEQTAVFGAYLNCFTVSGDAQSCADSTGVNKNKMNACVDKTNKKFGIMEKFNDQATWLSGQFPLYPIHDDLNQKYGVQGSPTLVINGAQVDVSRTPEAVKQAICAGFNNPPAECNQTLSTLAYQPGFGAGQGASAGAQAPGCGT